MTSEENRPFEAWFVAEVDLVFDRESTLGVSLRGPFGTEEQAERERKDQQETWERVVEKYEQENPYDFKSWVVIPYRIYDFEIAKLDRVDGVSYQTLRNAADAVGAVLLADEDVGPLVGDEDA